MVEIDETARTTECWRCGQQRYTYESCPHCGGSCKPLKKLKQKDADSEDAPEENVDE